MTKKRWRSRLVEYQSAEWHALVRQGWLTYHVYYGGKTALMCREAITVIPLRLTEANGKSDPMV